MSEFEIRVGNLAIREEADDEIGALERAVDDDLLHNGDEGNVEPADEVPVGLDADPD